jgi:hypothetical protein
MFNVGVLLASGRGGRGRGRGLRAADDAAPKEHALSAQARRARQSAHANEGRAAQPVAEASAGGSPDLEEAQRCVPGARSPEAARRAQRRGLPLCADGSAARPASGTPGPRSTLRASCSRLAAIPRPRRRAAACRRRAPPPPRALTAGRLAGGGRGERRGAGAAASGCGGGIRQGAVSARHAAAARGAARGAERDGGWRARGRGRGRGAGRRAGLARGGGAVVQGCSAAGCAPLPCPLPPPPRLPQSCCGAAKLLWHREVVAAERGAAAGHAKALYALGLRALEGRLGSRRDLQLAAQACPSPPHSPAAPGARRARAGTSRGVSD